DAGLHRLAGVGPGEAAGDSRCDGAAADGEEAELLAEEPVGDDHGLRSLAHMLDLDPRRAQLAHQGVEVGILACLDVEADERPEATVAHSGTILRLAIGPLDRGGGGDRVDLVATDAHRGSL